VRLREAEFSAATEFLLAVLTDGSQIPANYMARLAQPVVSASVSRRLDELFSDADLHLRLAAFTCDESNVVSAGLRDLLCFRTKPNTAVAPESGRWDELMSAALLGPHAFTLIDTGILLAGIADLAVVQAGGFVLESPQTIENFPQQGPSSSLRTALSQRKGLRLLKNLEALAEAFVVQQSVAYGDYTASLIERQLYDPVTRSIKINVKTMTAIQASALRAMRVNPILARNVVLIAMRHAIEDAYSVEKAATTRFMDNYYKLALTDFAGPQACTADAHARAKLADLLPNWNVEYRVRGTEKTARPELKACPEAKVPGDESAVDHGSGVVVALTDEFYVKLPTPAALADGTFEHAETLKTALKYRDRLAQAVIDRGIVDALRAESVGDNEAEIRAKAAFFLINEGLSWRHRRPQ
jgi:hypothetical protein